MAEQSQAKKTKNKFFKQTWAELKKVVWPTRNQIVKSTIVVIIVIAIVTLLLWVFDLLLGGILNFII